MDKKQYLSNLGYSLEEWTVLNAEEAAPFIGKEQHQNNMYAINDPGGKKAFGKGAFVVKKEWMAKNGSESDLIKPAASIPPPPLPPVVEKASTPLPEPSTYIISDFLKSRLMNLTGKGWEATDRNSIISPEKVEYPNQFIEEMENDAWKALTFVKPISAPPVIEKPKEEVVKFVCDQLDATGVSCDKQCGFCEEAESKGITTTQLKALKAKEEVVKQRLEFLDSKGMTLQGELYTGTAEDGKTYSISKEKVDTCNSDDFSKSMTGIEEFIKEHKKLSPENKTVEKIKEIVKDSGIPKENIVISSVPKSETEKKVDKAIEESEDIQELADKVTEIIEEDESPLEKATDEKLNVFKKKNEERKAIADIEVIEEMSEKEVIEKLSLEQTTEERESVHFFSQLSEIGFQQLNFTLNQLKDGKINVILKPVNFSGDPAYDKIKPLTLTGTPDELDEGFFDVICPPLKEVNGLMSNAKDFIDAAAVQEKATKAKKEQADKIKKLVEAAKKYHDDEKFDITKTASVNSAKKKWNAVLELDPKNKEGLDGLQKLRDSLTEKGKTFNFG